MGARELSDANEKVRQAAIAEQKAKNAKAPKPKSNDRKKKL